MVAFYSSVEMDPKEPGLAALEWNASIVRSKALWREGEGVIRRAVVPKIKESEGLVIFNKDQGRVVEASRNLVLEVKTKDGAATLKQETVVKLLGGEAKEGE